MYFLMPQKFENFDPKKKDVLGIQTINANLNISTIETTLMAYCISEGVLPENLNKLYEGYLSQKRRLDLDKLFNYEVKSNSDCTYDLEPLFS